MWVLALGDLFVVGGELSPASAAAAFVAPMATMASSMSGSVASFFIVPNAILGMEHYGVFPQQVPAVRPTTSKS
jgi:hypothetical protein